MLPVLIDNWNRLSSRIILFFWWLWVNLLCYNDWTIIFLDQQSEGILYIRLMIKSTTKISWFYNFRQFLTNFLQQRHIYIDIYIIYFYFYLNANMLFSLFLHLKNTHLLWNRHSLIKVILWMLYLLQLLMRLNSRLKYPIHFLS